MLKYEQAEQKLKKAIALDKKYAPAYNNLGNLYALQGNFEMAELEYEIALSTNPKLGAAYFNWAFVHLLQGKENLAFQKFKEGLKKSPSLQEGLGVLGIKVEKEIKRLSEEKFKSLLEKYEFLPAEKFKKKIKKNIFLPTINSNKILAQIFYWLE
jgi:tetratricopeptide (TPR) repeat protein